MSLGRKWIVTVRTKIRVRRGRQISKVIKF